MNQWDVNAGVRVKVSTDGHLPLVTSFQQECGVICDRLLVAFPEFMSVLEQVNASLPAGGREKKPITALSHLMATLEDGLLQSLEQFFRGEGYDVDSLEFDGLKPRRHDGDTGAFPEAILRRAEAHLAVQRLRGGVTIPMKLSEKALDSRFLA